MKKIYPLALALFVGASAMAADNGPHSRMDNRSPKENTAVRTTQDGKWNANRKVREQDTYYSSRYGNDGWGRRRDDRNDNWAYASDRNRHSGRGFDRDNYNDRGYDRDDQRDVRNIHDYRQSDHGYRNSKSVQRRY